MRKHGNNFRLVSTGSYSAARLALDGQKQLAKWWGKSLIRGVTRCKTVMLSCSPDQYELFVIIAPIENRINGYQR